MTTFEKLKNSIFFWADNPRVTRFNIDWDRPNLESSFMLINEGGGSTTTSIDGIPSGNMWNTINTTIENILPGGIAPSSALDNRMRDDLSMMQIDENINHRMEALSIVDASTIQSGFQSNDEFNEQFHKQNEGWKNNSIINYTSGHCFNISEDAEMAFH